MVLSEHCLWFPHSQSKTVTARNCWIRAARALIRKQAQKNGWHHTKPRGDEDTNVVQRHVLQGSFHTLKKGVRGMWLFCHSVSFRLFRNTVSCWLIPLSPSPSQECSWATGWLIHVYNFTYISSLSCLWLAAFLTFTIARVGFDVQWTSQNGKHELSYFIVVLQFV